MTWHEPREIARRLADRLGATLLPDPPESRTDGVLLLEAARLGDVPAAQLLQAAAVVVWGPPSTATSADLETLGQQLTASGTQVVLSAFATVADADDGPAEVPLVVAAPPADRRVAQLLRAGPHALTLDVGVDADGLQEDAEAARVCVVTFEVSGVTGGGIGTASTSLAETLARRGHDVTLLFTGWQEAGAQAGNARWREHYAARGVRLEVVREPGTSTVGNPHFPARSSYEIYCWLQGEEPFDVVHLPENMGHGAYAQLAKRQGAAFAQTTFVIGTHGPTRWAAEANRVALSRDEFLVNEALERTSVALADVLLGPSRYLHDYMRTRGWELPARVHVQPYAVPSAVRSRAATDVGAAAEAPVGTELPRELVFFGRLETRKGVVTLCDALDLLAAGPPPPPFAVTFLGPIAEVLGQRSDAYIAARAARWPWEWQIVSDRDQQGAAEYLARPGVLAIMPSTVDNAPNTVSEAVALGIPLVAGRTGGTGELVSAEQRDDHMFGAPLGEALLPRPLEETVAAPDAAPLAALLRRRLATRVQPARTPVAASAVADAYDRWHRAVRAARPGADANADAASSAPAQVAVCVLFDGDEALLTAQLEALLAAPEGVEIVVADLRPTTEPPPTPASSLDVTVVRPDRPGHAADARSAAVARAAGELIAIVPPSDVPLPGFVAGFRRAAAATDADAWGCAVLDELDPGRRGPADDSARHAFVPLPGPPLSGLDHPAFSAGPFAIRRGALGALGGWPTDAAGDEVDHELLNRAAARGVSIGVVPEPLAAKRRPDRWSTFRSVWPHDVVEPPYDAEQWLRIERPFADHGDLVGLLRGRRAETTGLRGDLLAQRDVYEAQVGELREWAADLERKAEEFRVYEAEMQALLEARAQDLERQRAQIDELISQSAARLARRTVRRAGRELHDRVRRR